MTVPICYKSCPIYTIALNFNNPLIFGGHKTLMHLPPYLLFVHVFEFLHMVSFHSFCESLLGWFKPARICITTVPISQELAQWLCIFQKKMHYKAMGSNPINCRKNLPSNCRNQNVAEKGKAQMGGLK